MFMKWPASKSFQPLKFITCLISKRLDRFVSVLLTSWTSHSWILILSHIWSLNLLCSTCLLMISQRRKSKFSARKKEKNWWKRFHLGNNKEIIWFRIHLQFRSSLWHPVGSLHSFFLCPFFFLSLSLSLFCFFVLTNSCTNAHSLNNNPEAVFFLSPVWSRTHALLNGLRSGML